MIFEILGSGPGLTDGCPKQGRILQPVEVVSPSQTAAVRCCSDNDENCITPIPCLNTTHYNAQEKCAAIGRRLCSVVELATNTCCGTGCGFDDELTWHKGK